MNSMFGFGWIKDVADEVEDDMEGDVEDNADGAALVREATDKSGAWSRKSSVSKHGPSSSHHRGTHLRRALPCCYS